jgi:hypothetical protein
VSNFNSVYGEDGSICWCLRHGSPMRPLDDVAGELGLRDGLPVTLYYEDESEEFEVSAVLIQTGSSTPRWRA